MGCTPSKLDSDDTVRRCKERRRLLKEAVHARHQLATAHSDYCHSLRTTASALVTFALGEPLAAAVSDNSRVALRRRAPSSSSSAASIPHRTAFSASPSPSIRPPPPPPSMSATSSIHHPRPPLGRRKPVKLPHILSSSSLSSSPPHADFSYHSRANSTYSSTPSQASSIWNWDNFYPPPSPPDSEFFHQIQENPKSETQTPVHKSNPQFAEPNDDHILDRSFHHQIPSTGNQFNDRTSNYSSYARHSDQLRAKMNRDPKGWESEGEETEREEVQCSEWGDRDNCSTTTSSSSRSDEETEFNRRSDYRTRDRTASTFSFGIPDPKSATKSDNLTSADDGGRSSDWQVNSDRRIVLRHSNLVEIVTALREYFDKAASAGDQVSEMLEAGRDQLDRSFKQLKKAVYHSSGILSNLSSTWTSKPPLTVKYQLELSSIEHCDGLKGLCSTLERLLAWEKKLYHEVKAREGVILEHEKKLAVLQAQEYRREDDAKLDKTKVSIKRLQSLISVTSQAVSTTSFAIVGLRDSDLVPQLVELCHGFMYMWRSMNRSHELQSDIVQQVRGLVNGTSKGALTSELHRQVTRDLESAVSAWHSSFCRLIRFQRDFVRALSGWFKLTLFPVNNEPANGNREPSEVLAFFDEWRLALDRIPDTVASEAIKSFNNVVHSIFLKQSEELKIKKRAESASKEVEKKASSIRTLEKKYYNSYSIVGLGLPDAGSDNGHVLDTRDPLAEKKAELAICQRRMEDEIAKYAKASEVTRAMTLNNIQTGLPGVFQAMTSFSGLIMEALETVCTRSYAI